jgi:hypothetical protein
VNRPVVQNADAATAKQRRDEHKRFSENHYNRAQTLAAWLLATVVAVNTSGAAGLMAAAEGADRQPAIAFAAGVALAVMSGLASWAEAYNHAGLHFVKSLEAPSEDERSRCTKCEWWAPRLASTALVLNVAALVAFVAGCVWSAAVL